MKVSGLSGARLDYWIALAEGHSPKIEGGEVWLYPRESTIPEWHDDSPTASPRRVICVQFHPSRNWFDGGPIIEREQEPIDNDGAGGLWRAEGVWKCQLKRNGWVCGGQTPLIAAMRAYIASKFGEEVPDDEGAANGD